MFLSLLSSYVATLYTGACVLFITSLIGLFLLCIFILGFDVCVCHVCANCWFFNNKHIMLHRVNNIKITNYHSYANVR
jgi:hypothetical protein